MCLFHGLSTAASATQSRGRIVRVANCLADKATAVVLAGSGHDNAAYELTGDTSWTYPELAAAVADVLGTPVTYQDLSSAEHANALRAGGVDEPTTEFLVQLDADVAAGVSAEATDQLRHLIGRPTTPLVDGLRAAAARPRS